MCQEMCVLLLDSVKILILQALKRLKSLIWTILTSIVDLVVIFGHLIASEVLDLIPNGLLQSAVLHTNFTVLLKVKTVVLNCSLLAL